MFAEALVGVSIILSAIERAGAMHRICAVMLLQLRTGDVLAQQRLGQTFPLVGAPACERLHCSEFRRVHSHSDDARIHSWESTNFATSSPDSGASGSQPSSNTVNSSCDQ